MPDAGRYYNFVQETACFHSRPRPMIQECSLDAWVAELASRISPSPTVAGSINNNRKEAVVPGTVPSSEVRPSVNLAQSLGRSLRHELGDFLQKVYASVAILEARLPANWQIEREVLSRLRQR